jgi:hypothetical protein
LRAVALKTLFHRTRIPRRTRLLTRAMSKTAKASRLRSGIDQALLARSCFRRLICSAAMIRASVREFAAETFKPVGASVTTK